MSETVIKIENLRKQYRLGTIGGGTLTAELQSWLARKQGKEDPNSQIGTDKSNYGSTFWALDGINLDVKKGEAIGIIGTNGAGKSTLLKILSRVTAPTEGEVKIKGKITSMLEVGTGFHRELTGRENIYMNGAILGMTKNEIDAKIDEIIEFSECGQFIDTPVKRYSSGMYVKLAFSVAAHLDSDIMIMDEVLAVGDMKFQQKCLGKMGDVSNKDGKTILYVSHNMNTIRQLCSRCIVLNKGKVIFDGDVNRAIEIYLQAEETKYDTQIICNQIRKLECNQKVYINKINLLNVEQPIYECSKEIPFELEIFSEKQYKDVHLRYIVCYQENAVGISFSPEFELVEGMNNIAFGFKTQGLAEGEYTIKLILSLVNEFGTVDRLDVIQKAFRIKLHQSVVDNYNIEWSHQWWGSYKLADIEIKRERE